MKKEIPFTCAGETLKAWFFLPEEERAPAPCIVMAHGFGGTKTAGLEPYAEHFQQAGFAVLVFDYRHFGDSQGEPRQLLSIRRQLEDWRAAVSFVRMIPEIDSKRIALWGTSFSGGHVVVVAAQDKDIACISAQCPMMDGLAATSSALRTGGVFNSLRMIGHGLRDQVGAWIGLKPHMMSIVGPPGSIAAMTTPDAYEGYKALVPEDFPNEVCARIGLQVGSYRPIKHARKVRCPALIQICEKDSVAPIEVAEKTASAIGPLAEVKRYPIGHFDIYQNDDFKQSVVDQTDFFKRHLSDLRFR
ncbi:MAG: alpha/beta hydrolase [Desulfobacterales bacterium]